MYSNMKYYENICNCLRVIQQNINRKLKSANCWQRTSLSVVVPVCGDFRIVTRLNPNKPNGLSHLYHLEESIFILRGIRSYVLFLFHFSMKIMPVLFAYVP